MLFSSVVETSRRVAETSKRLAKIDFLSALLRQLSGDEIDIVVLFLSGQTRQGRIGVGYAALRDARHSPAQSSSLEILEVDRILQQITETSGSGSQRRRMQLLESLFSRATESEQQFLAGLIAGELRQGALEGIMAEAVAKAAGLPPERVRRASMLAGDIARVARAALEKGESGLEQYDVQLFRPVQPMLAQSADDVPEALACVGQAALEYKMDGARVQVHKSGADVRIYSRSLKDVTAAIPDVADAVRELPAKDLILDGEVISLLPDGRPQPFQITMRRFGRRLDVERMRAELPMTPFWFDLLYLNGGPLLDEPQARRFGALSELSSAHLIPHLTTSDPRAAEDFLEQSLDRGHEGIMAKAVDAKYAAGARGASWVKVKRARTLDLVILAAEWGSGRRKGWLSNLHLGARDTAKGGFAMLGKTFKGLTDEMLAWQTQHLLALEIGRDAYTVYVKPELVVEIAFNEIQVSPRYASGLALRFARVKRYRTDKTAAEADTFETVQRLAGTDHPGAIWNESR
ncbi:MAG TPA: ATP-dependent DNA ligase [Bryobacteraceae bacterium]|nr:ATP-dependent DNA ligase [Bryobacteraceae bacterium]